MPDITKALVVFAVILLVYFVYISYSNRDINKVSTENFLNKIKKYINEPFDDVPKESGSDVQESTNVSSNTPTEVTSDSSNTNEQNNVLNAEVPFKVEEKGFDGEPIAVSKDDEALIQKFINKNTTMSGHKRVNYADASRGNFGNSEWMQYFDQISDLTNNIDKYRNDNFQPNETQNNAQAMQRLYNKKGLEKPEDLFDVDKFLPKDIRDDWFEVMPEPISVKNRHLINITRPIGVNTIGTSLRNPSHDIRGAPPCPKYVVSPWLNSSIEPDINIKPIV